MDMVLYALLKKKINGVASGVRSHLVVGTDLVLTFNDGSQATISFPTPKDGVSVDKLEFDETTNELFYYLTDGTRGSAGTIPVGKDGLSAYEIAKKNGFDGTEQEWLDSLAAQGGKIDIIRVNGEEIAINPDDKSVDIDIPEAPVQSISVNNAEVEPDENGNVNITIPKAPVQSISQDGTALEIDEYGNVDIPPADVNKIEAVKVNNTALEINEDKSVNIDLQDYAKTEEVEKFVDEQLYTTTTVEAHYEKVDAGTADSLEVVADDVTATDGQINVSNVTPVLDGEVIAAGDYVIWVEAVETKDAKFLVEADLDPYVAEEEIKVVTEEELFEKLGLSEEELQGLVQLISDTEVRIDKTYSSSKIYDELNRVLAEGKTYTLEEISKKTGASYKIATTTADMTSTEHIYLLANGDTYDMYIREVDSTTPVKIGSTTVDLNDYYTAEKTDALFAKLTSVGDLSNLKTEVNKSLVDAINWIIDVNAKTYATKTEMGDLTTLKTTDKTSIVNAINELEYANYNAAKTYATQTTVGELSALKTTDKDSIVDAINENFNSVYNLNKSVATKTEMGDLTILKTEEKSNIVGAVNEVYNIASNATTQEDVGDIQNLTTDDKTVVGAINEIKENLDKEERTTYSTAPIGTVLSFAGQTAPHGYLLCDGASYKVADYPHLYAVIGNTYGGDTENFNVPNLVDKFIQGSTTSGTEKEAGLPNIEGVFAATSNRDNTPQTFTGSFERNAYDASALTGSGSGWGNQIISFDASLSNAVYGNSDTVQPPALTMVYIIKAFHTNEGVDVGLNDETIALINQEIDNKAPTIDVQETTDGHSVTIVDKNGEQVFEVSNGKDGVLIDDTATGGSTTTVWSSSKTKNYVDTASKPVTILASNKSSDTGWNLKRGTQYDFGRLLLINTYNDSYSSSNINGTGSELLLIMGDYETAKVTSVVVAKTGIAINSFYSLEVSTSGTLVIKTTANLANSSTGKGKARLSFTFLN